LLLRAAGRIPFDRAWRRNVSYTPRDEHPFEGGSQPVKERPPEVPSGGRTVVQKTVTAIAVLVVLAAVLWILVPFGG
jgi:hypothetical protein